VVEGARFDAEGIGAEVALRAAGREPAPVQVPFPGPRPPIQGSGDPDAVAAALADLFSQTVSSSAQGSLRIRQELDRVSAELRTWRARTGEAGPEQLSQLLGSLERTFDASGPLPPESFRVFTRLLGALADGDDTEPPDELKALLIQLFPDIAEAEGGASLDTVASTLADMFADQEDAGP
jgi:hypothetical protein